MSSLFNHSLNLKLLDKQCMGINHYYPQVTKLFWQIEDLLQISGVRLKAALGVNCSKLRRSQQVGDKVAMALRCPSSSAGL